MVSRATFRAEDTSELVRLLEDNTRRLQATLDVADRLREQRISVYAQAALLITLVTFAALFSHNLNSVLSISVVVVLTTFLLQATISSVRYWSVGRAQLRASKRDMEYSVQRLEYLLRIGSQVAEHTEPGATAGIHLDFQLAISEQVLLRVRQTYGKPPR